MGGNRFLIQLFHAQRQRIERRVREYDRFQQKQAWNKQEITVTMTQGELQALLDSLWRWLDTLRREGE